MAKSKAADYRLQAKARLVMIGKKARRNGIIGVFFALGLICSATPILAASANGTISASCSLSYGPAYSGYFYHDNTSSIPVTNKTNDPNTGGLASTVWLKGENNQFIIDARNVAPNSTVTSPSNVKKQGYSVGARLSAEKDCNSAWPGKGNYTFKYYIVY